MKRSEIKDGKMLDCLTFREREVIRMRLGLGDSGTYSYEEIGRKFRIARERVRQIENTALRKLARRKG